MVQFQFYPYPLKKAWRYLSVSFNSDRETLETTTDGSNRVGGARRSPVEEDLSHDAP